MSLPKRGFRRARRSRPISVASPRPWASSNRSSSLNPNSGLRRPCELQVVLWQQQRVAERHQVHAPRTGRSAPGGRRRRPAPAASARGSALLQDAAARQQDHDVAGPDLLPGRAIAPRSSRLRRSAARSPRRAGSRRAARPAGRAAPGLGLGGGLGPRRAARPRPGLVRWSGSTRARASPRRSPRRRGRPGRRTPHRRGPGSALPSGTSGRAAPPARAGRRRAARASRISRKAR